MSRQTDLRNRIVCLTGASSGIGEACARVFAREGASLILLARRQDRLERLARDLEGAWGARVLISRLDVRNQPQVEAFFGGLSPAWEEIEVLVNNAGLSRGLAKLHEGELRDWEEMIDTNVKGLLYVSRAVIPGMVRRNWGHVVNIGSIAGHQVYPGGNVYCASKFGVTALGRGLRMDLQGTDVRVTNVDPGLVETEFSLVRYRGDAGRAGRTYAGMQPLTGEDVAEAVLFCVQRPAHVSVAEMLLLPTAQASAAMVHRSGTS
ncbi:MAG: SDR family NAD(P)-dependent oxidoreductase [Bacteroidota bacterium]